MRRYRRACDYLAVTMIYLRDNVLLRERLRPEHLKPRPLGHGGTSPVLNLVYSGLNRLVRRTGHRTLLVTGPEHGAPAIHANLWLEGTHREYDRALSLDGAGMAELVRRFLGRAALHGRRRPDRSTSTDTWRKAPRPPRSTCWSATG
jgi:xylulose-5-phosphate/fructose-6-phosphate phosphoketolase